MEFEKWATETINNLVEEVKEIKKKLGKNNNKKIKNKSKRKFTEEEKIILRNLPKKYKWIARDEDDDLCIYSYKPTKRYNYWNSTECIFEFLSIYNHIFKSIKWEDDEPCEFRKFI